jgi:hypothetical protein
MFSAAIVLALALPAAMLERADAPHDAFREGLIDLRVTVGERGRSRSRPPSISSSRGTTSRCACSGRGSRRAGRFSRWETTFG